MRYIISLGAVLGGFSVILGAFGAHSLKGRLTEQQLDIFQTAVQYQFYHSLALILVGILSLLVTDSLQNKLKTPAHLFTAGIVLFSGSLYGLSLGGPGFFGPITPVGGVCFILGWFSLAMVFMKK